MMEKVNPDFKQRINQTQELNLQYEDTEILKNPQTIESKFATALLTTEPDLYVVNFKANPSKLIEFLISNTNLKEDDFVLAFDKNKEGEMETYTVFTDDEGLKWDKFFEIEDKLPKIRFGGYLDSTTFFKDDIRETETPTTKLEKIKNHFTTENKMAFDNPETQNRIIEIEKFPNTFVYRVYGKTPSDEELLNELGYTSGGEISHEDGYKMIEEILATGKVEIEFHFY